MSTLERLKTYLDSQGVATGAAEKACGFGNATLRNAFEGGKGIGSDKLEKILSVYSNLSAEWLLRGTGKMLVTDDINLEQVFKAHNMPSNSDKIIQIWREFMEVTKGMQELYKQSRD